MKLPEYDKEKSHDHFDQAKGSQTRESNKYRIINNKLTFIKNVKFFIENYHLEKVLSGHRPREDSVKMNI